MLFKVLLFYSRYSLIDFHRWGSKQKIFKPFIPYLRIPKRTVKVCFVSRGGHFSLKTNYTTLTGPFKGPVPVPSPYPSEERQLL